MFGNHLPSQIFLTASASSCPCVLLEITALYNSMILSTLRINSCGFAFVSPKGLVPMEIVFLTYKPMIFLLISQGGTTPFNNPQQFSPRTKCIIEPPMEPSNCFPLIEAQLLSLEPSNKVHPLFDT